MSNFNHRFKVGDRVRLVRDTLTSVPSFEGASYGLPLGTEAVVVSCHKGSQSGLPYYCTSPKFSICWYDRDLDLVGAPVEATPNAEPTTCKYHRERIVAVTLGWPDALSSRALQVEEERKYAEARRTVLATLREWPQCTHGGDRDSVQLFMRAPGEFVWRCAHCSKDPR